MDHYAQSERRQGNRYRVFGAEGGKTTIGLIWATLMIASAGARTLIVDSDVYLRLLTAQGGA